MTRGPSTSAAVTSTVPSPTPPATFVVCGDVRHEGAYLCRLADIMAARCESPDFLGLFRLWYSAGQPEFCYWYSGVSRNYCSGSVMVYCNLSANPRISSTMVSFSSHREGMPLSP